MTASCGVEGAKGAVAYKPFVEGAVEKSGFKPGKIIVWQREMVKWSPVDGERGERHWQELVERARRRGVRAEAVPVKSGDGLYIIYTSGECARNISLCTLLRAAVVLFQRGARMSALLLVSLHLWFRGLYMPLGHGNF